MLKANTKKTLDIIASQKQTNYSKAYMQTHPNASNKTARVNVTQLLKKPEAQLYLDKHVEKAKNKVVELIDSDNEKIALQASESVLDRQLGKALTRTSNTNLNINIEDALNSLV